MADCIFCKIIAGEIPADFKYRDDKLVAFPDIHPQAPVHILIVTKKHIQSVLELSEKEESLIGDMIHVAKQLAVKEGIAEKGFRIVINTGVMGGQAIPHLHMHLLGGRQFRA
jgi:histidine triad (HIT) family protein